MRQALLGLMCAFITLAGGFLSVAAADHPPQPGEDGSGLSENETAALWSKTPNECLTEAEYEDRFGGERSSMHALANCTDITFKEPPETAETWTAYDFQSLAAGGSDRSVYPEHADREDSTFIKDAHATVFAVQPSTIVHQDANETTLYLAPDGELRGFVDYRVSVPDDESFGDRTFEWSLVEHEIEEVRVKQDGEVLSHQDGQHTPTFDYELDGAGSSTLTFEADIEVELEKKITEQVGNSTQTRYEYPTDSVTVSQELEANVYNLTAYIYYAEYPDGDAGVAIYQTQPWHGYELTTDEEAMVRGVWRYYTARDTDWDYLVQSTATDDEVVHSDVLPVYARAFPSEVGPRAEPIRDGPNIQEVWGFESESPAATVHDNVEIGIVDEPYVRSYGLAVRYEQIDRDDLEVQGIVRGESAEIIEPEGGTEREIRESELTTEIVDQDRSEVTIRIELRDADTGDPITLADPFDDHPRVAPIGAERRDGYITIADKRVETNASGVATVTIRQPGSYTAEYHPGSWRTHDPAYVSDRSSISWHPLSTAGGWFALLVSAFWVAIPFTVALYAGLKLGSFLRIPEVQ